LTAFTRLGTWFGASVVIGALASACGGSGETNATSSGTTNTEATSSSTSSSGTGGTGGKGTGGTGGTNTGGTGGTNTGGMGGTGGAAMGPHGPQASQLVNSGDVVKSPSYKMVFTLGQPTQNQTKTTSPSYRMQGGLVGANGTLP
jgi:hypothetical protein